MTEAIRERYEPQETVARGAGGEVIRALDREHGRTVAIKVRAVRSQEHQEALQSETRLLIDLRPHPSIPLVRDGFFVAGRHYLVSDWVDGTSLDAMLAEHGEPLRFTAIIGPLREVAVALDHLHAHYPPVVHGDVRPANVIVTHGGRAMLTGIGRDRWERDVDASDLRAPETRTGAAPTPAADVYGLGATAFTLLSGSGPAAEAPLRGLPRGAVAAVERVLRRALSAEPQGRPSSARELVDRLASWLETELPSGTVTFLLTDIEGSTRMWEAHPAEMSRALARHDEIVAASVERHGGFLLKTRGEGDSTFSVFERAGAAVRAAVDMHRALAAERWPTPEPLRARLALHTGEGEVREGDYYGPVVNRCARLRAIGVGGQLLVSDVTHDLVRDQLPAGVGSRVLGEHELKDLARAENVFQLVVEGGQEPKVAAPAAQAGAPRAAAGSRRVKPALVAALAAAAFAIAAVAIVATRGGGGEPIAVTTTPPPSPAAGEVRVPDLTGLEEDAAAKSLRAVGLRPDWAYISSTEQEEYRIVRTEPAAGTFADEKTVVTMFIAYPPGSTADLDIAVEADADEVRIGAAIRYVITLNSLGPYDAEDLEFAIDVTGVVHRVDHISPQRVGEECFLETETHIGCYPGYLPANRSLRAVVVVIPRSKGTMRIAVSTRSDIPDDREGNNRDAVKTRVR